MPETLKVTLIQTELIWENPAENLKHFDAQLKELYGKTDLVILPEMFTTGFSMNPQGNASGEEIYDWLYKHARLGNLAIYGSVMFDKSGSYCNRGIFMKPDGQKMIYDKRHTFTLAGEHKVYDRGNDQIEVFYKDWQFKLQICYDLRFPVFARNTTEYDAVIYVANWPVPRINAWDALLKARAIENMCYSIGVNRVGTDGTGMDYCGHSQVYDVLGNELLPHPWTNNGIQTIELHKDHIRQYRDKLRFLEDRDLFILKQ
ncbi:nitrilase family protein [Nonlabens ponticola]|uniref:Omega-amidase YafV n=1 Tax=Nonlabens ponticola TaxID=2496866 RepID=A0A3S9MV92_9FLAO|nr:nitrilase family protein [Nonlabens ponticola]AZQ43102.1 nitrilase family protein [Nonlabens ponticola]